MSESATILHTTARRTIHLVCAAQAHENIEAVVAVVKKLANDAGYGGPFSLHYKCPKPRIITANAVVVTDHPIRMAQSPQDLLGLIVGFLKCEAEVHILGHYHVMPNTEAAVALLKLDDMRKAMRCARIKEGLFMAKQRGVHVGRKRIDAELVAVQRGSSSYRRAAKSLKAQGIEISKSTLHAIARGRR